MEALRATGVWIHEWDGAYPACYARGSYLPTVEQLKALRIDLIHLNWDPQAINHFLPEHFAEARAAGIPLSVFLHDVPPNSSCPVQGVADVVFAHEPGEGITVIDHAVPDYRSNFQPADSGAVWIGTAGIRDDPGVKLVDAVCRAHGWWHSKAGDDGWLTTEQEIDRLAACTVNVAWYACSGRGKSMGAMFMVAAQRPLLLSGSSMFSALWDYEREIAIDRQTHTLLHKLTPEYKGALDPALTTLIEMVREGQAPIPRRAARALAWSNLAPRIHTHWQEVLRG